MVAESGISIALIISIASLLCTVINTLSSGKKVQRESYEADLQKQVNIERNFAQINVKLDDFCDTTKMILTENARQADQIDGVVRQLSLTDERIKTLFKYKDEHEDRIKALEMGDKN